MARERSTRSLPVRFVRGIGIAIVAMAIVAAGIYFPATLVGPLPAAVATPVNTDPITPQRGAPPMPEDGASAIATTDSPGALASSGMTEAVPLGGAAKIISVLVTLDKKPLTGTKPGPDILMTSEDAANFARYKQDGVRAVDVVAGEKWTEREVIQTVLLSSSNNHTDTMVRWAFGSDDEFLDAAAEWLEENDLTDTELVDSTGLDEFTVGTAADLALVTRLASQNEFIAETMTTSDVLMPGNRRVMNVASYHEEAGVTSYSLSFSDHAGLCLLFSIPVTDGDREDTIYGAFLRAPDHDTLGADLDTVQENAAQALNPTSLAGAKEAFVKYETAWGTTSYGVAVEPKKVLLWQTDPLEVTVDPRELVTARAGTKVGSVSFEPAATDAGASGGKHIVVLELDKTISDPGMLWRLTNPVPVITELLKSFGL